MTDNNRKPQKNPVHHRIQGNGKMGLTKSAEHLNRKQTLHHIKNKRGDAGPFPKDAEGVGGTDISAPMFTKIDSLKEFPE